MLLIEYKVTEGTYMANRLDHGVALYHPGTDGMSKRLFSGLRRISH
jgi:hypothetical protein